MNKCLEMVNDRYFWNPGVFSYAMIPKMPPQLKSLFIIVKSIVYGDKMLLFTSKYSFYDPVLQNLFFLLLQGTVKCF